MADNIPIMPDAKGPVGTNPSDYLDRGVYNLVKNGQWNLALQNAQYQDVEPVLRNWLYVNAPNINTNDQKIVDLVKNWYMYFKQTSEKSNPFFSYLKSFKKLGVKPTYNDLVSVNNKYQERVLDNQDLQRNSTGFVNNDVLANKSFYKQSTTDQNWWLDIYAFLSSKKEVDKVLSSLPDGAKIQIGNDEYTKEELSTSDVMLRDCVMFEGGNPSAKLRPSNTIESALNKFAEYVPDEQKTKTTNKKTKEYRDKDKLNDFLNNKGNQLLNDRELLHDVKVWLSGD